MNRTRLTGGWLLVLALAGRTAATQETTPGPQDQLDLQARANVVQGSGARALGMGGAFLARADDATAASWNPAGLSYLRLPEMSFVYSGSRLETREKQLDGSVREDRRHGHTPDFAAATYPIQLGGASGSVQLSFQRVIAFGGTRTISDAGGPQFKGTSSGGFDVIALGGGLEVARHLRLGITLNRWFNGYHQGLTKQTAARGEIFQEADYRLSGWNANVGLIWSPREALNVGLVYKSPFTATVDLARHRVDTIPSTENQATSDELGLPLRLDLPEAFGVGLSWRARSTLTLSADYTRTRWSQGRIRNFFTLPQASVGAPAPPEVFPELPYPSLDPTTPQHDTEQIRAGLEFVILHSRLKVPLRVGAFSDRQYFGSLTGDAPRFLGLTAGAGIIVGRILFDAAYVFEYDAGQYITIDRSLASLRSHHLIASLIYRHPRH